VGGKKNKKKEKKEGRKNGTLISSDQTDITYCDQRSVTIQRNGALSIKTAIIDIWKSNPEGNWRRYKTSPYTTNDKLLSSSP
jgi:hypothetical protein